MWPLAETCVLWLERVVYGWKMRYPDEKKESVDRSCSLWMEKMVSGWNLWYQYEHVVYGWKMWSLDGRDGIGMEFVVSVLKTWLMDDM